MVDGAPPPPNDHGAGPYHPGPGAKPGGVIYGLGVLLWLAIAGAVVWVALARRNRPKCPHCGLSVDRDLDSCPYCHHAMS